MTATWKGLDVSTSEALLHAIVNEKTGKERLRRLPHEQRGDCAVLIAPSA